MVRSTRIDDRTARCDGAIHQARSPFLLAERLGESWRPLGLRGAEGAPPAQACLGEGTAEDRRYRQDRAGDRRHGQPWLFLLVEPPRDERCGPGAEDRSDGSEEDEGSCGRGPQSAQHRHGKGDSGALLDSPGPSQYRRHRVMDEESRGDRHPPGHVHPGSGPVDQPADQLQQLGWQRPGQRQSCDQGADRGGDEVRQPWRDPAPQRLPAPGVAHQQGVAGVQPRAMSADQPLLPLVGGSLLGPGEHRRRVRPGDHQESGEQHPAGRQGDGRRRDGEQGGDPHQQHGEVRGGLGVLRGHGSFSARTEQGEQGGDDVGVGRGVGHQGADTSRQGGGPDRVGPGDVEQGDAHAPAGA